MNAQPLNVGCAECGAEPGNLCTIAGEECPAEGSHSVRFIQSRSLEAVNHPAHYGGEDNPYEAIKVIEAWGLGFNLGNAAKYIARAEHKGASLQDLKKSVWYIQREIAIREKSAEG